MFLSSRAIYILVFNLNQHIDDLVTDDVPYFDCSGARSHKIEGIVYLILTSKRRNRILMRSLFHFVVRVKRRYLIIR